MSVAYRIAKNYTLPLAAVLLVVSLVGLAIGLGLFEQLGFADVSRELLRVAGLWVLILSALGLLIGGWYVAEQLWNRRKFERLIATDKRSEFTSSRKDLDDLARRLPDSYRPRIKEKEAAFGSKR